MVKVKDVAVNTSPVRDAPVHRPQSASVGVQTAPVVLVPPPPPPPPPPAGPPPPLPPPPPPDDVNMVRRRRCRAAACAPFLVTLLSQLARCIVFSA